MPRATTSDRTSLFYKDWGPRDGDPVLLLHGWPLSADTWDEAAVALAESGKRCIAPDRRGFGRSDQPWDGYDYDTFADDLLAVLDDAGIKGQVSLVGFSMGGGEVARFLTRHGKGRVKKAVLIGSVVPFLLKTGDNPDGVDQSVFDGMAEGIREDRAQFFRGFLKDFFGVGWVSHPVSDGVLDNSWRQAMNAGLRPTLAAATAFATTDFRPDLASFAGVPTLVIHGTDDKTVPIDLTARKVAEALAQADLKEYGGSAHGLFATDRDKLIDDLKRFLA